MNLLVTNTQAPQSYAIVRALRPHASRIVATYESDRPTGRLAPAANSRLVDRRRPVPSPVADWHAGRVDAGNTPREEAFLDAVKQICEEERIDVIFPSWDPYVYVFAKNRAFFEARGIAITVPDFETVLTALDKYRTVIAGRDAGVPCPATYLYDPALPLDDVIAEIGFPIVLKPRFTSGGHGMAIVADRAALNEALPAVLAAHGPPMMQEYIPGGRRDSMQFVVGRDGAPLFVFHKKRSRTLRRTARFGTVSESAPPDDRLEVLLPLVRRLGWWGAMGIETIRDPRDGVHKLMEINPRFPRQLWNRTELGVNEPLMCVRLARGEPVDPVPGCAPGVLFVNPVEDVQLLVLQLVDALVYGFRTRVLRRAPLDGLAAPPPMLDHVRSFARTYRSDRPRLWDPHVRYFLQDPLPAALWWLQFATWMAGGVKQVGR